jgi:hypothetical protein
MLSAKGKRIPSVKTEKGNVWLQRGSRKFVCED